MESPPRLGLGTINIAPFVEGLIYYQSTCLEFRYGEGKMLDTQPHPTCESTSTHYVLRFISLKTHSTFALQTLSHTHTHIHQNTSSKQHGIISSQTLAYICHASHHISNSSVCLSYMALYHIQGRNVDMVAIK